MAALAAEEDGNNAGADAPAFNKLEDDGSGQVVVNETPELLEESLRTLRTELGAKLRPKGDGNKVLQGAACLVCTLLPKRSPTNSLTTQSSQDEFLLRFLRCTKFDVPSALQRYVAHWYSPGSPSLVHHHWSTTGSQPSRFREAQPHSHIYSQGVPRGEGLWGWPLHLQLITTQRSARPFPRLHPVPPRRSR